MTRESASQGAASAGRNDESVLTDRHDESVLTDRQKRAIRRDSARRAVEFRKEAEEFEKRTKIYVPPRDELIELENAVKWSRARVAEYERKINEYKKTHPNSTRENDKKLNRLFEIKEIWRDTLVYYESRLWRYTESHKRSAAGSAAGSSAKKSKKELTDYKWVKF